MMNKPALPKILIIDDLPANLLSLRQLLSQVEAEIVEASSGNDALSLLIEHEFALLLLDVDMPIIDGYEVARMTKAVQETSHVPIIFLTAAFKDDAHRLMGYESGGVDYLEKPINEQILLSKVHVFLELYLKNKRILDLNRELEARIAKQVKTEAALRESEERYHDLYDNAPDMYVSVLPESALIRECNQTLCNKLGYSKNEIIGRPIFDLYHPECIQAVNTAFQSFISTGSVDNAELILMKKDGSQIPVILNVSAAYDQDGNILHSRSSWRDISDQKEAGKQIKILQQAVEQSPTSIVITDVDGNIEYVNPKFSTITGYSSEEIVGQNPRILKSGHTTEAEYEKLWQVILSGQEWHGEFLNERKDGTRYWENVSISPVQNDRGTITHFVAVKEDVTLRRINDQRLQMAMQASNDGIWDYTIKTGECFFSPRWAAMLDLDHQTVKPHIKSWKERIHPDDQATVERSMEAIMIGNTEELQLEYRMRRGSGDWLWMRTKGKITERDLAGEPLRIVGTQSNITHEKQWLETLKQSNKELQISEENYRSLVSNVPGVVYRCALDSDWTMQFISKAVFDLSGYHAQEFIGNHRRSYASIIYPEDRDHVEQTIQSAIQEQRSFDLEYRIIHNDGTIHWVYERGCSAPDRVGERRLLEGVIVNITLRKKAELSVNKAFNTQRVISNLLEISLTPQPLPVQLEKALSLILQIEAFSKKAKGAIFLLQPQTEELVMITQVGFDDPLLQRCARVSIGTCLCGQAVAQQTTIFSRNVDERHEIDYEGMEDHGHYCVPIKADNQPIGVLCLYTDPNVEWDEQVLETLLTVTNTLSSIIQRSQLDERLHQAKIQAEQATRSKSRFLAAMSHDIRTPMNAILGMGEVLDDSGLNPVQSKALRVLTHAGENLLALINDILDLSKVEAGQLQLENISFVLKELVEGTCQILYQKAVANAIGFHLNIHPDCPHRVMGDPQRIRQVLLNLLGNALKFTQKGEIILTVNPLQGDLVQFSVSDTGIGISGDQLEQIFNPFVQAESSTTRRFGGTGLGLSICSQLIQIMGGQIQVESAVGKGSRFLFTIPLPHSTDTSPATAGSLRPEKKCYCKKGQATGDMALKILIADDAKDNLEVISAFLSDTPHHLRMVANGEEATRAFKSEPFDIVLMDMHMPILDGFQATAQIRSWETEQGQPPTPIVALTANAMREDMEKTAAFGCDVHLSKPVRKARLLEVIRELSPKKKRLQALRSQQRSRPGSDIQTGQNHCILNKKTVEQLSKDMGGNIDFLVNKFLELLPECIQAITDAIEQGNTDMLEQKAHCLRGGARTLGANHLAGLCGKLEQMGKENNLDGTHTLASKLEGVGELTAMALREIQIR
ncbi:MAG: PAS domain S-box protein [Magnetococcales bacterium]|nr:PAS domain S-box protein [Magnetococcales bacterium]